MIDPNDHGTMDLVAACEEPLSGAARAKRHREKKKLAGVKSISLTSLERCVLSLGLLAHEDLDHRPANWETTKKPEFDALLHKLWPEGDSGRYLAEPKRSTYRPAAYLRNELERQRGLAERLDHYNRDLRAEVESLKSKNAAMASDWQTRAEKAEAELAYLRAELANIGQALPVTN